VLDRGDKVIEQERRLPPLALFGPDAPGRRCLLIGEEQKFAARCQSDAIDPKRTWLAGSICLFDTPFQMLICVPISTARPDGI
jgi:hypothetical protein